MMRSKPTRILILLAAAGFIAFPQTASSQPNDRFATVVSKPVARTVELPGEFQPFLNVAIHARVSGYVEKILVDRGSIVKEGDVIAELSAPEMASRIAEAESKVQSAQSDRVQAQAQAAAFDATYQRLKKAAETPGAIAENELIQAQKQMDAAQALIQSREASIHALEANVKALRELQSYLKITAPFDGVITDRFVHPGALVGSTDAPLVNLQQVSKLRLIVAVPEEDVAAIPSGARVEFRVPSSPDHPYFGTVARTSHALDPKTRTMPVELDVVNTDGSLSPGMYPQVKWPVRRARPVLLVPASAVVTTTERTFVIREHQGRAQWVDVRKGLIDGDRIEVSGDLHPGDRVLKQATDEIRDGTLLSQR